MPLTAVDLFAGAGGVACGLKAADYDVVFASDWDEAAAATYRHNFPADTFVRADVHDLTGAKILKASGLRKGELDLLIGGPPCQGFSIIGGRVVEDPRNSLFREFLRIGREMKPRAIVIENVPGLATLAQGAYLDAIVSELCAMKYRVRFAELLAAQYGVPQMRWRFLFVAFRDDLDVPSGMGFPRPTRGDRGIGELIPNCTIPPEDMAPFVTLRDAIGDLPPVAAGATEDTYVGPPVTPYQRAMRAGLSGTTLHNHYAPALSAQNIARIAALKPGQDWRDLPHALLPDSMKRAKRKDHTMRFKRMAWDMVPRSIITRFRDPKTGAYSHPEQVRSISIREAARIQSFPDRFRFLGNNSAIYDQVGNAVPPLLAESVVREVAACLRGEAEHVLVDAFRRRPSFQQLDFSTHL